LKRLRKSVKSRVFIASLIPTYLYMFTEKNICNR